MKRSLSTLYLVESENLIILKPKIPDATESNESSSTSAENIEHKSKIVNFCEFKTNLGRAELSKLHDLWMHRQFALCEQRVEWLSLKDRKIFVSILRIHLNSTCAAEYVYLGFTDLLLDYFPDKVRKAYVRLLADNYPKSPWIRDLIQTKDAANM